MMRSFIVFKWELKKAFRNPLYLIVFLIIPLLLLLLSTGNQEKRQQLHLPLVVGLVAPPGIDIRAYQSDTLILLKGAPDTLNNEEKKAFFFRLLERKLLAGAVIISPGMQQWILAENSSGAETIRKWISKIIRQKIADSTDLSEEQRILLTEGVDQASTITLQERDGMAALWLIAVFVFGVALTGSVFAKSMYEERKGKLLEVYLTTCSPGELVWGKFAALFVFSLLQFGLLFTCVLYFAAPGGSVDQGAFIAGGLLGVSSLFFLTAWYFFTGISVYSEIGFVGLSFLTLMLLALPVWMPAESGLGLALYFQWIPFTMFQSTLPGILRGVSGSEFVVQVLIQITVGILFLRKSARLLHSRIDR